MPTVWNGFNGSFLLSACVFFFLDVNYNYANALHYLNCLLYVRGDVTLICRCLKLLFVLGMA